MEYESFIPIEKYEDEIFALRSFFIASGLNVLEIDESNQAQGFIAFPPDYTVISPELINLINQDLKAILMNHQYNVFVIKSINEDKFYLVKVVKNLTATQYYLECMTQIEFKKYFDSCMKINPNYFDNNYTEILNNIWSNTINK